MRFDVISVLPMMLAAMRQGVTGRAIDRGAVTLRVWNPRDFADDAHRTVDDRPYGGGPGMVMMVEPLRAAIAAARAESPDAKVAYLSPQGRRFDQRSAEELAQRPGLIVLAGRYEGIDERLLERAVDEEWSIGDYVLSGGELPAMVLMDAVIRLLPGVLGHADSAQQDSFTDGLLDCPHYTRPEEIDGQTVPPVLLSGDHEQIRRWRLKQALGRTWSRRPDLLESRPLSDEEQALLDDYIRTQSGA